MVNLGERIGTMVFSPSGNYMVGASQRKNAEFQKRSQNKIDANLRDSVELTGVRQLKEAEPAQDKGIKDYYSYLQKSFDCVRNGNVTIAGSYLKECAGNPEKAKELESNLSYFKEGYEGGLRNAKANARAMGARLVDYSESWSIDSKGNITAMASTTLTSEDGAKNWKDLADKRLEKLKEKKEQQAKQRRMEQTGDVGKLRPMSHGVSDIVSEFEKVMSKIGGGSESDETKFKSMEDYINKMPEAYQIMKDRIEKKYAAPVRQKEYYTAADGSIQELTKERELGMLDSAYERHSRFVAKSQRIQGELQYVSDTVSEEELRAYRKSLKTL